jgi:hypothetical protein
MHNCKATRERIHELALDGTDGAIAEDLTGELRECQACDREFNAVVETMRLVTRGLNMAAPPESYWPGYHARLEEKLRTTEVVRKHSSDLYGGKTVNGDTTIAARIARLFPSFIMVRTPVAAAVLILFVLSLVALAWTARPWRARSSETASSQAPSVVQVPVEVPVIREKIVTRVVYRPRKTVRNKQTSDSGVSDPSVVKNQATTPPSLTGFKPTNEIKLTVIKGGLRDEN